MTTDDPSAKDRRALARRPSSTSYAVGYGKPPEATRFRPGTSGNPKGRPKGRKNKPPALNEERLQSIILEEAYRAIKVNDGTRQVTVPMAQAIVRSLAVTAVKGNTRAQRLFAELLATTENSRRRLNDEWLETAINYKVEWDKELLRRKNLNIAAPDPLPHPDDIVINFATGAVEIRGPMSREHVSELDQWLDHKAAFEAELAQLQQDLDDPENTDPRHTIEDEIADAKRILDIIQQAIDMRASEECVKRRIAQRS